MRRPTLGARVVRGLDFVIGVAEEHARANECGAYDPDEVLAAVKYLRGLRQWFKSRNKVTP